MNMKTPLHVSVVAVLFLVGLAITPSYADICL